MEIDYSTIAQIARCPKRYKLNMQGIVAPISAAIYLGSTFHLVQHLYFGARIAGTELLLSDLLDAFDTYWVSYTGADSRPVQWDRDKPNEQAELGRALVKAYYPYAQKIQPLLVEHKFSRDTVYGLVYGTIDLMATSGSIIDYKTSARVPYKTDIERELQPTVYSFLLGGSVDFQYHYIIKQKLPVVRIFPTRRNNGDLSFFEKSLLPEIIRMIQIGVFPPLGAATGACRWCSYQGYCGV